MKDPLNTVDKDTNLAVADKTSEDKRLIVGNGNIEDVKTCLLKSKYGILVVISLRFDFYSLCQCFITFDLSKNCNIKIFFKIM